MLTLIHNLSRDTIRIFMCHLKASNSAADELQRLSEVNSLRAVTNNFPAGTEFLIPGDFNIYRSTENCYNRMLEVETGNNGQFVDPYTITGVWNQSSYAQYHSQSTRVRSFGGGATGGMDDRFDFILNSSAITQEGRIKFIPNSLKPFGNDGNHYNDSINKRPNTEVPDSIADALAYSSYNFRYTDRLVSKSISNEMLNNRYEFDSIGFTPILKIKYVEKEGDFSDANSSNQFHGDVFFFDNDITLVLYINSYYITPSDIFLERMGMVINAFDAAGYVR